MVLGLFKHGNEHKLSILYTSSLVTSLNGFQCVPDLHRFDPRLWSVHTKDSDSRVGDSV